MFSSGANVNLIIINCFSNIFINNLQNRADNGNLRKKGRCPKHQPNKISSISSTGTVVSFHPHCGLASSSSRALTRDLLPSRPIPSSPPLTRADDGRFNRMRVHLLATRVQHNAALLLPIMQYSCYQIHYNQVHIFLCGRRSPLTPFNQTSITQNRS